MHKWISEMQIKKKYMVHNNRKELWLNRRRKIADIIKRALTYILSFIQMI